MGLTKNENCGTITYHTRPGADEYTSLKPDGSGWNTVSWPRDGSVTNEFPKSESRSKTYKKWDEIFQKTAEVCVSHGEEHIWSPAKGGDLRHISS